MALQSGHEVCGLVRPVSADKVPAGVQRVLGVLPYDIPRSAMDGCSAIIHLAAITTSDRASEAKAVNQISTDILLRMAENENAAFIFVSTQSAHGGNPSAYAVTKRNSEELVRNSALEWTIVRPGLVYGPGFHGLYARMRATVTKMPIMPLLGGGKAIVQPIHVDDLCKALLTIIENPESFSKSELNVGDPKGLSLKDFVSGIARAQSRKLRSLNIPLGPVKLAVAAGEKLRLPLPISMDNLRGLETVQRMDTQKSLDRLHLKLRDLDNGLVESEKPVLAMADDRLPVLLIGAGKIGIVHSLQLLHNSKVRLAGVVEPSNKAVALYKSMGFKGPYYSSLEDALQDKVKPIAAVIATPAFTHVDIAEKCLDEGLHILVEKPLAVSFSQAEEWRALAQRYKGQVIHAGYMAAQFPHLLLAYHAARMNSFGHIYKARAVALQTHITSPEPVRWEMLKEKSGGGAMINFGCHVASILFRLLGWPDSPVTGYQWPIYSTQVEDALAAKFSIKATQCSLLVSWSVPDYARPYNLVELECEHGTIRVENSAVYIIQDGVTTEMKTQLDYDLEFNMAPDYTGGGFTMEHEAFVGEVKSRQSLEPQERYKPRFMPPVEMAEALRLENWIFELYETLKSEKPTQDQIVQLGIDQELGGHVTRAGHP